MAKQLNKKLVVGLTIAAMLLMVGAAAIMIRSAANRNPEYFKQQALLAIAVGDYTLAGRQYARAATAALNADYHVKAGVQFLLAGDANNARKQWSAALLRDPKCEDAQIEVVKLLLEYVRMSPNPGMLQALLAESKKLVNSEQEAKETSGDPVGINPNQSVGLHARGLAYLGLRTLDPKNTDRGRKDLERAFELAQDNPDYALSLSDCYLQFGKAQDKEKTNSTTADPNTTQPAATAHVEEAEEPLRRVLAKAPNDPKTHRNYGLFLLARRQKWPESLEHLQKAIELKPDDPDNHIALGQYWLSHGAFAQYTAMKNSPTATAPTSAPASDVAAAEQALTKAVEADPDGYLNYLALAQFYYQQGMNDKTAEVCQKRLARGAGRVTYMPERDRFYKLKVIELAFQAVLAQVKGDPKGDANKGYISTSEDLLNKAIAEAQGGQEDPMVLILQARLHGAKRDYLKARDAYLLAEQRSPTRRLDVSYWIADMQRLLGETGDAEKRLREVVAQDANVGEGPLALLSAVLVMNDKPQEAIALADRILRVNPNNAMAKEVKARAEYVLKPPSETAVDAKQVEAELRAALQKEPANLGALNQLLNLLQQEKRTQEIPALLDKADQAAKAIDPKKDPMLQSNLKQLRIVSDPAKSDDEKYKALEDLVATIPYPEPYQREVAFARMFAQRNNWKAAGEHIQKACEMSPKDPNDAKIPQDAGLVDLLYQIGATVGSNTKDWTLADKGAEFARVKNLDNAGGYLYLGRLCIAKKQAYVAANDPAKAQESMTAAISALRTAMEKAPNQSNTLTEYGAALFENGSHEEARSVLEKSLELNPNQDRAHRVLAGLAEIRGDAAAYEQHFARAERLNPNDNWVRSKVRAREEQKDPKKAIVEREKQRADLAARKDADINARLANMLRLAELYAADNQPDKTEEMLKEANDLNTARPEAERNLDVPANYARFVAVRRPPAPERGLAVLQAFVDSFKSDMARKANAQLLVARFLQSWASTADLPTPPDLAKVDDAYLEAAKISPSPDAFMSIGGWYATSGRLDKAVETYEKALAAIPPRPKDEEPGEMERAARKSIIQTRFAENKADAEHAKRTDEAIAAFKTSFPNDTDAAFYAAEHLAIQAFRDTKSDKRDEKVGNAISAYSSYIQSQPKGWYAFYRRALLNRSVEKYDAAIDDLKTIKQLAPAAANYEPRVLLAKLYFALQRPDEAIAELQSILKENENNPGAPNLERVGKELVDTYTLLDRLDEAEELALKFSRQYKDSYQWPAGLAHLVDNRPTKDPVRVIGYLKQAAEIGQYNAELVSRVVRAMLKYNRPDEVIDYLTRGVPADRVQFDHKLFLASAYAVKGQKDVARKSYEDAMKAYEAAPIPDKDPALAFAILIESVAASPLGHDEALKMIAARRAASPDDNGVNYAEALMHTSAAAAAERSADKPEKIAAEYAAAEKSYRAVLAQLKDPKKQAGILLRLAPILTQQKKHDECRKVYEKVLQLIPDHPMALNNLAYQLIEIENKPKEALQYSRRAAEILSNNADVLDTYGWNLSLVGRHREAIVILGESIQMKPEAYGALYHRAQARAGLIKASAAPGAPAIDRDKEDRAAKAEARRAYEMATKANDAPVVAQIAALLKELKVDVPTTRPGR